MGRLPGEPVRPPSRFITGARHSVFSGGITLHVSAGA